MTIATIKSSQLYGDFYLFIVTVNDIDYRLSILKNEFDSLITNNDKLKIISEKIVAERTKNIWGEHVKTFNGLIVNINP